MRPVKARRRAKLVRRDGLQKGVRPVSPRAHGPAAPASPGWRRHRRLAPDAPAADPALDAVVERRLQRRRPRSRPVKGVREHVQGSARQRRDEWPVRPAELGRQARGAVARQDDHQVRSGADRGADSPLDLAGSRGRHGQGVAVRGDDRLDLRRRARADAARRGVDHRRYPLNPGPGGLNRRGGDRCVACQDQRMSRRSTPVPQRRKFPVRVTKPARARLPAPTPQGIRHDPPPSSLPASPSRSIATGAAAAARPVEKTFGNTIVSTYPDGREAELWLQRGGSYTARGRRGDGSSGHWSVKGGKLCLSQSRPIPSPFSFCTAIPDKPMGATWTGKAVTGEAIRVKVIKGNVSGHR